MPCDRSIGFFATLCRIHQRQDIPILRHGRNLDRGALRTRLGVRHHDCALFARSCVRGRANRSQNRRWGKHLAKPSLESARHDRRGPRESPGCVCGPGKRSDARGDLVSAHRWGIPEHRRRRNRLHFQCRSAPPRPTEQFDYRSFRPVSPSGQQRRSVQPRNPRGPESSAPIDSSAAERACRPIADMDRNAGLCAINGHHPLAGVF